MNFNIYNEDRFKQRLRDKYGVKGDVREYLKQNYDSVVSSYQNLMTSYGEYQKLTATMAEVKSKIDNIKEAQKLMPYEILMENGDFKSYLTADYSYYNLLNQDQLAVLSQQEVALYDYLYRTRSKAEADAYLKAMENTMNQRIGAYKAAEYIEYIKDSGYGFNDLLASGWEGTKDGVRNFFDGIADCFRVASTEAGTKSALDYEMMYKTQFMQQLMSDPSYINQDEVNGFLGAVNLNTWYNTGTSIGNMVVPSLVSFVPGGHLLSITLMTMSITGNTAVEAKQEGYSTSQAYLYGAVSGLSETATEVILGGIPGISNLEGKGFVAGMLSEGFEEFTQEYLDVGVRWAILGEKPEFTLASMHDTFSRASQAGIQGAMTSGIMQGGNAGLGVVANSTTRALSPTVTHADGSVSKAYNSFGEFKNTMESNFYTPKAETAISDAIAKVGNGENISFADKIKLNRAISNVSAQELSGITKNLTTDQKASLKSATSGIVKMSSDTSAKLDTADTFAQVESATDSLSNVNNLSKDALNSEVTRDGRTLAEYIADTKTETLDNNTMEMIKSEDPKIAKEMTKRIEKRQKAQFKAFKKQFMEQKQEDATRTPVKTAVQQDSQNASAPATSQQGATDVQVKAAIQQEVPKAPVSAPIQQEAVKASVSATIQQEAVKAPVSATIQQEAVKAPVSVDIQQEAAKAPLSAAIQQEAPKAPASAAIQQEAPKAPASATIQQEAVKAPVTASIKQGASKAPVSAAIQQEAVKAPVSATIQQEAVKAPVSVDIQQEAAKAPLSAAIQQETPKAPASAAIQQEAPKAPVTASIKQGASKSSVTSTSQLSDVVIPAANSAILEYVVSHNSNAGKKGTKINVDMSKIDTSLTPAGNYAAATSAWNAAGRPSSGETYSGLQSSYAYSKLAGGSNKDAVSQLHQQDGNINYKTSMFRSNATTEQGMSNATFSEMVSKNAPVEQQSGIKVQENVEQQNGIKPKNDVKVDMSTDAAELYRSSFEKWRASNMPNEGAVYDEYIAARDLYYETMDIKDTEMANRYHPDRIGTENGMVYDENGMVERSAAKSSDIVEGDTVWDREVSSLLGKGEKGKGRNNVQAAKQESNAKTVENLKQDIKTENTLEQKDTSKQIESVEQQKDIKPTTDTKATENLDQNIKVEETLEQKETGKQTESTEQQDDLGKVVIPAADPTILEYVIPYNSNAGKKGTKINVDMSLIDRTLTPDGNYSVALSAWNAAGRPSSGEIYSRLQSAYAYSKLAGGSNKAAISQLHQQDGNINYRTSIFRSNATTEQGMSNATFSELVEKSNSQVSSEVVKNNLSTTEMVDSLLEAKTIDNTLRDYISKLDQKSKEIIISSKSDDVSRAVIDSMVVDGKIGLNTITENALQNIGTEYVLEINRPLTSDEIMLLSYSQIKVDNGSGIPTDSYSYASTQMMLSLNDMETVDETVKQYISRMDYNSKEALISKKSDDVSRAVLDSMIVENKLVLNHDFNQNTVDNLPDGCKLIINKPLSAYELTILSDVKNVSDRGIEIKVGTKFENARVAALEEMTKRLMDTKEVDNIAKLYISHLDQKSKETIISSKSDAVSKEVLKSMQSDGRITLDTITEIALENIKSTGYVLDVNRPLTSDEIMLLSESDVKVREYTDTIPAKTYAIGEITSSLLNTSVVDETVEQYISKLDQESKELIIGLKSDDVSRAVLDSMVVDGKVTLNVIAKYTLENIKKADYVLEVNRPLTSSELELIRQNGIKIEDNKQNGNINSYSFDEMTSSLLNTSVVDETVKQYISKLDQKSKELIVASKVDDVSKEVLKSMSVNGKISLNTITENTLDNIGTEYVLDVSRPLTSNEILLLSKSDIKVDFNSNPNADPISAREYAIDEMVGSLLGTSVVDETVKQYISAMDNLSKERIIANKSDDVSKAVLESMQVDSKIKLESSLTAYKLINIKDAGYVLEINRPLSSDEVLMLSLDDWSDIKVDFNSNPNADPILAGEYAIDEMKSRLLNTSVVDETVKRYISRFDQKSKEIIIASKCDDVSKTVLDSMVVDGKISLYTITETALQNIESTDYVLDINKTLTSNEILLLNKSDINVLYYDNTLRSAKWVANSEMVMELLETGIVNENVKKYISAMDSLSKETIIANKVDDVSRAVIDSMVVDGKVTLDTITETALQNIKSAGYVLEANGNYSIRDLELISQNGVSVGEKTVSGSEYAFKEMVKASIRNDSIISNYIEKNQDIVRTDDGIFNFVSYTVSTNPSSYSLTAIDIVVDVAIEKFGSVREGFFSSVADSSKTIGYGVDQGILHNLMKYKYRGNEYTYHSVRKLVDDYFAQGKIIPHFNESHSNEYIAVKDFISNKYNFSSDDASVALIAIDNIGGACNYASFANEIMASFIGKEADFYKAFGFPMYVTTDGIKRLNASQLMADIFITINSSEYGGKLFNVDTNGVYTVNRSLLLNEIDPEGRKKLNSGKQQYLQDDLRQSLCSRYLNLKGIKYETKCLTYNNGLGSFEELAKFKLDIANGMRDGKHYSLGVYGSKYFKIKMINKTLEDSRDFDGSGGHSVYITGMTKDGFTVSSWGRQYLVEYNDLINGAFDIDCASFSQKVLSTTEIVENLLEAKTVDDTLRDYISNLDQKSKEIIIASKCDDVSKAVLDSMVVDGKISLSTITDNTLKNIGTEYVLEINRPLTSNEIISLSKYEIKVDTGDGNISSSNIYANTQILSKLQDAKIVDDTVKQYIRNMNYHLKETLISSKVDDVSRAVINSMILNNELLINTSFNQNTL